MVLGSLRCAVIKMIPAGGDIEVNGLPVGKDAHLTWIKQVKIATSKGGTL